MPFKTISYAALVRSLSLQGTRETLPPLPGDDAELEISGCLITAPAQKGLAVTDKLFIDRNPRGERKATPSFTFGRRTNIFKNYRKVFPYLILEGMTPADATQPKSTTTRPQARVPVGQNKEQP